jgi:S1-C subfamily serine protease
MKQLLLTLALPFVLAPAPASHDQAAVITNSAPTPYLIDNNAIARIQCGQWVGTGSYLGNGLILTAMHVAAGGNCEADDEPAKLVISTPGLDYAILRTVAAQSTRELIDCSGYHEGQALLATGFAEGALRTVTQRLTASGSYVIQKQFYGEAILRGSVTQGMSGGPIVDLNTGALVGIVNANTDDGITQVLSLPVSETALCRSNVS